MKLYLIKTPEYRSVHYYAENEQGAIHQYRKDYCDNRSEISAEPVWANNRDLGLRGYVVTVK